MLRSWILHQHSLKSIPTSSRGYYCVFILSKISIKYMVPDARYLQTFFSDFFLKGWWQVHLSCAKPKSLPWTTSIVSCQWIQIRACIRRVSQKLLLFRVIVLTMDRWQRWKLFELEETLQLPRAYLVFIDAACIKVFLWNTPVELVIDQVATPFCFCPETWQAFITSSTRWLNRQCYRLIWIRFTVVYCKASSWIGFNQEIIGFGKADCGTCSLEKQYLACQQPLEQKPCSKVHSMSTSDSVFMYHNSPHLNQRLCEFGVYRYRMSA